MSAAREEVLARVRANLARDRGEKAPAPAGGAVPGAPTDLIDAGSRLDRFREMLESVGGHVHRVQGEDALHAALATIIRAAGAQRIAVSDAPIARRLAEGSGCEVLLPGCSRKDLLEADLGLTTAQHGIAETGTLVLASDAERHRLASLVPPIHVAVLDAAAILGTLGEALEALHHDDPSRIKRTITFVTGPSRTADIELTLVVGVHGPRELHVLLLDPH